MLFVDNAILLEANIPIVKKIGFNVLPHRTAHGRRLKVYIGDDDCGEIGISDDPQDSNNFVIMHNGTNTKERNAVAICYFIGIACYKELLQYIKDQDTVKLRNNVKEKIKMIKQIVGHNNLDNPDKLKDICIDIFVNEIGEYPPIDPRMK